MQRHTTTSSDAAGGWQEEYEGRSSSAGGMLAWLGSVLMEVGGLCVGLLSAVVGGTGGRQQQQQQSKGVALAVVGAVVLALSLGHLVLLWKVIQLLSALTDKLDGVLSAASG